MEMRVYIVDADRIEDLMAEGKIQDVSQVSDEQFIQFAEEDGTIYSIEGFQTGWNTSIMMSSPDFSYIRFIQV